MNSRRYPDCQTNDSETEVLPSEDVERLPDTDALYEEFHEEVEKLRKQQTTRGDLKILLRAVKELRYSFNVFKQYRKQRKVTVFGSARTSPDDPTYQHAVEFGRRIAECQWMVLTGAGGGIMEAAHVGSGREMAMGVNIMLPFEQSANPIIAGDDKLVHLKYFFTRKLLFVKEVHAIALYPGGFGTQDEGFEALTLVQTGKRDLMPIVCLEEPGGTYWSSWLDFVKTELLDKGLISPNDLSLFKITTDIDEALDDIFGFYSAYHSMRFVGGKLVLRLHVSPPDEFIEELNDRFGDLLASGRIERCAAHPVEADDAHILHLPRLRFDFNRRHLGLLRKMVDVINERLGRVGEPTG